MIVYCACANRIKMASYNEPSNQICRKWLHTKCEPMIKKFVALCYKMEYIYIQTSLNGQGRFEFALLKQVKAWYTVYKLVSANYIIVNITDLG